ncbi:terminase large subunit domain-containing protein [Nocardia terpenica]|uniref:Uncharacterized protein n=1 Tax=Nocardia terpenica TaxID=455432 RepID=A0A164HFI2_9NOCA|nr:terminase family protein [Nocardia terpenica]KZM68468.1 hypothetical protein AWN90_11395 [Nocardia terpenica]NQE88582.1 hypothetical protein [Nocardia terpenica]
MEDLGNLAPATVGIKFVARYGLQLDPWQELVFRSWLSFGRNGKYSHSRCGLSVPRQCGKSALLEARALVGMCLLGERILFTAHATKTARAFFQRLLSFFEDERFPELAGMVEKIRTANGLEVIRLRNGGSLQILARSKGSGRGLTVDVVLFDEAQECSSEALEALGPTTAAAPLGNRQLVFAGTPPSEVMNSEVFTRFRDECLSGRAVRASWLEWAMPEGSDLDDPQAWAQANPALGYRLGWDELAEDRAQYSDEGFARERGGMWSAAVTRADIDGASWRLVADGASQVLDPIAIGVDISPDRSRASIAIAGARADELFHVEVTHNRKGTEWVAAELRRMVAVWSPVCVVVDGPAASLVPELAALDVPVYKTTLPEYATACALFYDYVMSGALRHVDQPIFNTAVEAVRKRVVGDLWVWGRRNAESDVTPVVAATVALFGFINARPKRRGRRKAEAVVL